MAIPDTSHYRQALAQGDTLGPGCHPRLHWVRTGKERWIEQQCADGWQIVAVELAEGATALPRLEPARQRTVVLLGHEWHGVPEEQVDAADVCVEIPMVGRGASLNVAVAGSLVLLPPCRHGLTRDESGVGRRAYAASPSLYRSTNLPTASGSERSTPACWAATAKALAGPHASGSVAASSISLR